MLAANRGNCRDWWRGTGGNSGYNHGTTRSPSHAPPLPRTRGHAPRRPHPRRGLPAAGQAPVTPGLAKSARDVRREDRFDRRGVGEGAEAGTERIVPALHVRPPAAGAGPGGGGGIY